MVLNSTMLQAFLSKLRQGGQNLEADHKQLPPKLTALVVMQEFGLMAAAATNCSTGAAVQRWFTSLHLRHNHCMVTISPSVSEDLRYWGPLVHLLIGTLLG